MWEVVNLAAAKWGTPPQLHSQENSSSIKASGLWLIKGLWLRSNYSSPAPKQQEKKAEKVRKERKQGRRMRREEVEDKNKQWN